VFPLREPNSRLTGLLVPAVIVAADRALKLWARGWLRPRGSVPLAPFFSLTYVENTGAAFGTLKDSNAMLIAVALALLAGLLYARRRLPAAERLSHWGILLVIGGALGNLYDRLTLGFVVDFLDFRVWPVFNLADSCICMGAVCLGLGVLRRGKPG